MSVPRISAFGRYASGNVAPDRTIEGQQTHLSRTMHGLAFDPVHDEIIVPVTLSGAVLVFQRRCPRRSVARPHHPGIAHRPDPSADRRSRSGQRRDRRGRLELARDSRVRSAANGDVAPKRKIGGPKTDFRDIVGVAVDPVANVIIAANRSAGGPNGLYIFDRMADGDVAPSATSVATTRASSDGSVSSRSIPSAA